MWPAESTSYFVSTPAFLTNAPVFCAALSAGEGYRGTRGAAKNAGIPSKVSFLNQSSAPQLEQICGGRRGVLGGAAFAPPRNCRLPAHQIDLALLDCHVDAPAAEERVEARSDGPHEVEGERAEYGVRLRAPRHGIRDNLAAGPAV